MTPARLRPSFLKAVTEAVNAMRTLVIVAGDAHTSEEEIALLQAINRQALSVIVLVHEVLDA